MDTQNPLAALGLFARHPVPGQVKTRLAAAWGGERAAELYAAFVADTADCFRATADRRYLCYTPAGRESADFFAELAGGNFEVWPQPDAPLGERLEGFFRMAFAAGAQRAVVIGSDSPTLPREHVERAFELLAPDGARVASITGRAPSSRPECVLGPATDGGYCLVGLRDRLIPIFSGIEWSTPRVLVQTVERLRELGASLGLLPEWYDIDDADDLDFLRGELDTLCQAGRAVPRRTTALILSPDSRLDRGYTESKEV